MNTSNVFEIESGCPLPLSENDLFYNVNFTPFRNLIYFSKSKHLNKVQKFANIDFNHLLGDFDLSSELFGGDYKIIVGIFCGMLRSGKQNYCLIDLNYINIKLQNNEDRIKYLLNPHFFNNPKLECHGNKIENGFPIDPITMEPIPEEERFLIGNTCYFKETVKQIANSNNPVNPITREPLSEEILSLYRIFKPDHVILNGIRCEIYNNCLTLSSNVITDISPISTLTFLKELYI